MVLELHQVTCGPLNHFNIGIHAGECVVIQSLDHIVFQSLTGLLTGENEPEEGSILLEGRPVRICGNKDVAVIQEQPTKSMIFHGMSYMDNLCFGLFRRLPHTWRDGHIMESVRMEYGPVLGEETFSMQTDELTEMQKYQLVYTRILLQRPKVVFCIQPFKGADLPHRIFIWKMMEMLLDKRIAVVIVSMNLSDSMAIAGRLVRVDGSSTIIEISKEEFSQLSVGAPWSWLYQEKYSRRSACEQKDAMKK